MARRQRLLQVAVSCAATIVLAGCQASHGAVDGAVHSWRQNGVPFATVGGVSARPGQTVDFDTYVVNDAGHPVLITGVRLIRLPGHRAGRLAHVALETGENRVGANRGWPPTYVRPRPLLQRALPPGRSAIAVGMSAPHPGIYVAAGLLLTYRDRGRLGQAQAWGGGLGCFSNRGSGKLAPPCPKRMGDRVDNAVSEFIHHH